MAFVPIWWSAKLFAKADRESGRVLCFLHIVADLQEA